MVRLPSLAFSTPACVSPLETVLMPSTVRLTLPLPSVLIAALPVLILVSLMVTLAVVSFSALMVIV